MTISSISHVAGTVTVSTQANDGVKAQKLLERRCYQKALEVCERELQRRIGERPLLRTKDGALLRTKDGALLRTKGAALLNLDRLAEALQAFAEANDVQHCETPGSQSDITWIGVVQWLQGQRAEAIQTFRRAVDGVLDGSITYTDGAGGADQGLLLFYSAATVRDEATRDHAARYLTELSKRSWIDVWPGPLALLVLGKISAEQLHDLANKKPRFKSYLPEIPGLAERVKRQKLCDCLFYMAVRRRAEGDERGCLDALRQCAAIENPIWTKEWYLARAEVEKAVVLS